MFAGENRREERRRADASGGQGFVSVNTLLSDGTGVETRIPPILDYPKEVKKGRQKELSSLGENDVMTNVRRSSAAGKPAKKTRLGRSRERTVAWSPDWF